MDDDPTAEEPAPQAMVLERARFSIVWLIPLIAAIVGLYLAYWAWMEKGPTITISFESAEGLEAARRSSNTSRSTSDSSTRSY